MAVPNVAPTPIDYSVIIGDTNIMAWEFTALDSAAKYAQPANATKSWATHGIDPSSGATFCGTYSREHGLGVATKDMLRQRVSFVAMDDMALSPCGRCVKQMQTLASIAAEVAAAEAVAKKVARAAKSAATRAAKKVAAEVVVEEVA